MRRTPEVGAQEEGTEGMEATTEVRKLLYLCPHATMYVSACYCTSGRGDGGYEGEDARDIYSPSFSLSVCTLPISVSVCAHSHSWDGG